MKSLLAVYPLSKELIKSQTDLTSLLLMMEFFYNGVLNNYYSFNLEQLADTYEIRFGVEINRSEFSFYVNYLEVFEKEALEFFNKIISFSPEEYNFDYFDKVIEEYVSDYSKNDVNKKLIDSFCKKYFLDYRRYTLNPSPHKLKKIKPSHLKETVKKLKKIKPIILNSSKISSFKFQKLDFKNINFVNGTSVIHCNSIKNSKLNLVTLTTTQHIQYSLIYALEKYLRDEVNEFIEVSRKMFSGLSLVHIYFYPNSKVTCNSIESLLKNFSLLQEEKLLDYLRFGEIKYNAILTNYSGYMVKNCWEECIFNAGKTVQCFL